MFLADDSVSLCYAVEALVESISFLNHVELNKAAIGVSKEALKQDIAVRHYSMIDRL